MRRTSRTPSRGLPGRPHRRPHRRPLGRPHRSPLGRVLGAVVPLAVAAALLSAPTQAAPGGTVAARGTAATGEPRPGGPSIHSSDGVRGETAAPLPAGVDTRRRVRRDHTWPVVPGLTYRRWSWVDRRGPVRAHLLSIDVTQPGLALDYLSAWRVPRRAPVTRLVARGDAVAGVNGDFFDIGDTGAPLGVGRGPGTGVVNARSQGWTKAFWVRRDGTAEVGTLPLVARIRQHPRVRIQHLNSPTVSPGHVGVYDRRWGRTPGTRATDGRRRHVREVVVSRDRVVSNRRRLSTGRRIGDDIVLIGRGPGAEALRALRPGTRARITRRLPARARLAIGGSVILLDDGAVTAVNDVEMHPRTAVGIDRDGDRLLLLVVDGRQRRSRGLTMVELAELLRSLGAEDALNLDGGGSSTMVAPRRDGELGVVNRPSDGTQRRVPNGLGITWTPPVRR